MADSPYDDHWYRSDVEREVELLEIIKKDIVGAGGSASNIQQRIDQGRRFIQEEKDLEEKMRANGMKGYIRE